MKRLILLLSVSLVSCGKGGSNAPTPGQPIAINEPAGPAVVEPTPTPIPAIETPVVTPVAQPIATVPSAPVTPVTPVVPVAPIIEEDMYIIGGDAHAERFQYFLAGNITSSGVNVSDLHAGESDRVVGYTKKYQPMSYWSMPGTAAPLLNLVSTYCGAKPYFIWYQGDAETSGSNYKPQLNAFLGRVKQTCPVVKIVIVKMTMNFSTMPYANTFLAEQSSVPSVMFLDSNGLDQYATVTVAPGRYLNTTGYSKLWDKLKNSYPLKQ